MKQSRHQTINTFHIHKFIHPFISSIHAFPTTPAPSFFFCFFFFLNSDHLIKVRFACAQATTGTPGTDVDHLQFSRQGTEIVAVLVPTRWRASSVVDHFVEIGIAVVVVVVVHDMISRSRISPFPLPLSVPLTIPIPVRGGAIVRYVTAA